VLALALLIGLQFAITCLSVRSEVVRGFVKAEPTLLLHDGRLLKGAMRRERMTKDEMRAALRSRGVAALEQVEAVVLETDSSFSVVKRSDSDGDSGHSALANVTGPGARTSRGS
jgi:uncharacterized membrane protein YcaP (DUF421 family)